MLTATLLVLALNLPQDPTNRAAAEEAQARAELRQAAQAVDDLLLHASKARDQARIALDLTASSEAKATQADRARLAKLATDLRAELEALQQAIDTHAAAIKELRLKVDEEVTHAKGTVPWFKDRVQTAKALSTPEKTRKELRSIEGELSTKEVQSQQGVTALLGFVRYLIAESLREDADTAIKKDNRQLAVGLLRDASKKLTEVLDGPDETDTDVGSSLHAAALFRKFVIETRLYVAFARQQSSDPSTAKGHRENAAETFRRLERSHPNATLPDGSKFVAVARAEAERLQQQGPR